MVRRRKREDRRERIRGEVAAAPVAAAPLPGAESKERPDALRPWLLAGATALVVARPLVMSDGGVWIGDGEPFAALWLVLAIIWALGAIGRPRLYLRWTWIDTAVAAFFAWWSVAALVGADHGAPRPSFNALWDGVSAFLAFFLLRQLNPIGREARAIVVAMLAVGIVQATIGYHQSLVTMPADRARFEADPQKALREAGVEELPVGSIEFELFKSRLTSTEALGTFSLTNSLAALLAPWLIIALGIAAVGTRGAAGRRQIVIIAAITAGALGGVLAFTRSRSAWIAVGVGVIALWLQASSFMNRRRWLFAAGVVGLAIIVVIGLAVAGPAVLEPATRSFAFRLDYWQSTLAMIRDHVWLGCGPGNFGDYYTAYKLPTASEEIKDPHNVLFEVTANAGVPALLFFATVLIGLILRTRQSSLAVDEQQRHANGAASAGWIYGGTALGVLLAMGLNFVIGFNVRLEEMFVGTVCAGILIALFEPWVQVGRLPPSLVATGIAVLLVALLAVGGMTFAGVSGTLWLLAALLLDATDPPTAKKSLPWSAAVGCLLIAGPLFAVQHQTGYQPVMKSRGAMAAAHASTGSQYEQQLLNAAAFDPWAIEPWQELAAWRLREWKGKPATDREPHLLKDFDQYTTNALALNPRSFDGFNRAGMGWMEAYRQSPREKGWAKKAAARFAEAVRLYPTSAVLQARWATALEASGDAKTAEAAARESLRLDDLMPHADHKLSPELRGEMRRIANTSPTR